MRWWPDKSGLSPRTKWIRSRCSTPGVTILDIGAHNGDVFAGSGLSVTLLDINGYPPTEYPRVVADAHSLPFPDGSFDICCLNEILEHVHDPALVLREACRVAQQKVVFTVPSEHHWADEAQPFKSLETTLTERGLTEEEHFWVSNPTCTQFNDMSQIGHRRYYDFHLLQKQFKPLGLQYSVMLITNGALVCWCGEIYK